VRKRRTIALENLRNAFATEKSEEEIRRIRESTKVAEKAIEAIEKGAVEKQVQTKYGVEVEERISTLIAMLKMFMFYIRQDTWRLSCWKEMKKEWGK
jgi:hypothetical protein